MLKLSFQITLELRNWTNRIDIFISSVFVNSKRIKFMSKLKTILMFSIFILLTQKFLIAEGLNNSINIQQNSFYNQKFFFKDF